MDMASMNTFAGRLATFEEEHHVAKRRASTAKKKQPSAITWPHENPTPELLAKAGFYYKPSANSPDSVTCFLCNKALDGWDQDDSPALEHLSHVPECGWAINVCIEQSSENPASADEEDPTNAKMTEARLATFGDWWPHEGKRGWKCTVTKMVNSGWTYDPLPEADDCVKCFYCGVSLDGWEPKDDPLEEHRKRAPKCKFFLLTDIHANKKAPAKAKKSRTSRTSKVSRLSTQSNMSLVSEAPSLMPLDDEDAEEGDTVMTTASTVSKANKGRKQTTKAKSTQKKGRKAPRQQEDATEAPSDKQVVDLEPEVGVGEAQEPPEPKSKSKRGTKRTTKQKKPSEVHQVEAEPDEASPPRKTTRGRQTKKQPARPSVATESVLQVESSAINDDSVLRPKRGVKRTSDGQHKTESSIMAPEEDSMQAEQPKPKPRGRPKKISIQPSEPPSEVAESAAPKPKPRGRPKKQSALPQVQSPEVSEVQTAPQKQAPKTKKGKQATSRPIEDSGVQPDDELTYEPPLKPAVAASGPARQPRTRPSNATQPHSPRSKKSKALLAEPPTSSPQSSDAENHLPSSRVSLASRPSLAAFPEPPSTTKRVPPAVSLSAEPAAITTPPLSPSKRNIITGGITTTQPWTAIDVSRAYPLSPHDNVDLNDMLADAQTGLLTSPEKQMTVEEWILWNAARAEERMRGECERMIQRFEEEGGRAMRVLEGVECVS